ncbi:DNA repair exonuclease [Halobacillus halophilus]|uniref:DNA repair exonuclease family protein n=1 Tax=Halobacillus halophilus (strain ATCC 35676 / DSM 2266 / JCM 20832 / KCTC 3685 / LMG 17431 / NBRC 102448 / NCIMB 2269) TaxID=866895 RepID=I0JK81_HALH3|nr:DNA repair exonuclease [Halobacillus halophilus]ASF38698.1 DNA repair exonuclease [Halobacillus halophilus]CCG44550.1 DNA repair exonuclease family protein [Halobacillus halophilus DSM 2266]
MPEKLRFIHAADLHLDSLFKSKSHVSKALLERLRMSTFEAFDRLIDAAIRYQVDFVLIVGDLFNEEMRSLKAQIHLRKGFERLADHAVQVYVSYGNHDFLQGAHYPIDFPENVHIFTSQDVEAFTYKKKGEALANLYGFSYVEKKVTDRKVNEYSRKGGAPLHIAMLHGSLDTNTEHDVYAPFRLEELYEKQMDYWALGHIHKRQFLSEDPPIVYPGNIQGRSRKESGEKGCYLIDYDNGEWKETFLSLQSFVYETISLSGEHLDTPQELERILDEAKSLVQRNDGGVMLEVILTSTHGRLKKWQSEGLLEDWIELLNEDEGEEDHWVWIDRVRIEDKPLLDEEDLRKGQHFTGELLREIEGLEDGELENCLSPLFRHRKASRFLETLSVEEKQEIIEAAKTLTLNQLLTKEGEHS